MPKAEQFDHQANQGQNTTNLLDPQEVFLCKQLAAGDPPWGQRAQSLLAINDGASAEAASEASGLRTTQVNFWLNKFHKIRMGVFPEELLKTAENNSPAAIEASREDDPAVLVESGKTKKKKKKNKQGKSKKKKTKAKKGKRSKKSGKTKKK